jgi:succinate dehydrogenase / fumarate reductase membrane anchor subunit
MIPNHHHDKLATSLKQARGQGSGKHGSQGWWALRVTAVALIPLGIYFILLNLQLLDESYEIVLKTLHNTWIVTALITFVAFTFHHAGMGMREIYEDYITGEFLRRCAILGTNFLFIVLSIASIISILRIYFS